VPLDKVVLLGSAYAFGRVLTVYITGRLAERLGPLKVLAAGVILIALFLLGIPTLQYYYAGMFFAFLGGIGMGAQDTVCPVLLSIVYPRHYDGSLSAGQALFGLGSFATPFLVGVMLAGKLPFYYSYYCLLVVPLIMLVCIPFVRLQKKSGEAGGEEKVQPLYTKHRAVAYGAIIFLCAAYCAAVSTLSLYISSFAQDIGISQSNAAFMLTVYNIGSVAGSFAFVFVLKRIKAQTVLMFNQLCAFIVILAALFINMVPVYFIGVFLAGLFLGVLFSVIVAIATRIGYRHISVAGSFVATAGGISDIITPMITGFLVGRIGIGFSFWYALIMIALGVLAAVVLRLSTTDRMPVNKINKISGGGN